MARKLFVRFSSSSDEEAIFDFYERHQHEFVAKRDPDIWKERISSGAVTIIHDEDGNIVASSISYPVTRKNADGEEVHAWTEIGSTRVALDGLGLIRALLSAQVLRAYLLEPPEDRFALEIIHGNEHSKHVFLKAGATSFDIPDEMREKVLSTLSPEDQGIQVEWFQLGVEVIPQFARTLLEIEANARIVNKKTGEEFEIDFSQCVLITMFREQVEDMSGHDFGDAKQPNLKHGIKPFRDKFHP